MTFQATLFVDIIMKHNSFNDSVKAIALLNKCLMKQ